MISVNRMLLLILSLSSFLFSQELLQGQGNTADEVQNVQPKINVIAYKVQNNYDSKGGKGRDNYLIEADKEQGNYPPEVLNEQNNYASELFNKEAYFDAVTEYKRLLYFDTENQYSFNSSIKIGNSYKMGGRFSDALLWYTKAEINASSETQIIESRLSQVKVNILRRTTKQAFQLLDSIQTILPDSGLINYWRAWAFIFNNEWNKAATHFSLSPEGKELSHLCDSIHALMYDEQKALILSYIIPGAGQIYTKHYESGLLSLGWNVLWGYLTINAFQESRVFDGLMTANFLWLRFYTGNIQNASAFAREENNKISDKALDYLQRHYMGGKP